MSSVFIRRTATGRPVSCRHMITGLQRARPCHQFLGQHQCQPWPSKVFSAHLIGLKGTASHLTLLPRCYYPSNFQETVTEAIPVQPRPILVQARQAQVAVSVPIAEQFPNNFRISGRSSIQ